jgi:hypothetical protein
VFAYGTAIVAVLAGLILRIAIARRPPVTNMYESVIYVGSGVALFGLFFFILYRNKYLLAAASAVATVAWVLADNCPTLFDPSVRPLEPVLRSNFWLVIHVMTITLSYAAFALALGVANITLGYFALRSANHAAIAALSRFTYKAIQVGVLLLAAGIILGGVWADYSWGRFWGWDPKEVWALVALLGYLAGIPTYSLSAELALCLPLRGHVAAAPFPPKLATVAPQVWRFCRSFSLDYARMHAKRGNLAGAAGQAAAAIMEEAHAIVCERGQWVCNEKRLIETAGLGSLDTLFAEIPIERKHLLRWLDLVSDRLGVPRGEATPWKRGTL